MAETNHRVVTSEPLPLPPLLLSIVGQQGAVTPQQQFEFNRAVIEYLRRLRQLLLQDLITNITQITDGGLLPAGTAPCVLIKQIAGVPAWLTVPDLTKHHMLVFDKDLQLWKLVPTSSACP